MGTAAQTLHYSEYVWHVCSVELKYQPEISGCRFYQVTTDQLVKSITSLRRCSGARREPRLMNKNCRRRWRCAERQMCVVKTKEKIQSFQGSYSKHKRKERHYHSLFICGTFSTKAPHWVLNNKHQKWIIVSEILMQVFFSFLFFSNNKMKCNSYNII